MLPSAFTWNDSCIMFSARGFIDIEQFKSLYYIYGSVVNKIEERHIPSSICCFDEMK